jgi:AmiR/NasT family two-component response regulator
VLVVAADDQCERFRIFAETHPLALVAPPAEASDLWPALLTAAAAGRRHRDGKAELARLEQRLAAI